MLKKILTAMLCLLLCLNYTNVSIANAMDDGLEIEPEEYYTIEIIGSENIKEYFESTNREYDPKVIAIQRTIRADDMINAASVYEFVIKNYTVTSLTDTSHVLREYRRPAGEVRISETITVSNKFSFDGKIKSTYLDTALGYETTASNSFEIYWSNYYSTPVIIKVYPIYEITSGELWEEDVWFDDYYGSFEVYRAVGDEIIVFEN